MANNNTNDTVDVFHDDDMEIDSEDDFSDDDLDGALHERLGMARDGLGTTMTPMSTLSPPDHNARALDTSWESLYSEFMNDDYLQYGDRAPEGERAQEGEGAQEVANTEQGNEHPSQSTGEYACIWHPSTRPLLGPYAITMLERLDAEIFHPNNLDCQKTDLPSQLCDRHIMFLQEKDLDPGFLSFFQYAFFPNGIMRPKPYGCVGTNRNFFTQSLRTRGEYLDATRDCARNEGFPGWQLCGKCYGALRAKDDDRFGPLGAGGREGQRLYDCYFETDGRVIERYVPRPRMPLGAGSAYEVFYLS